MVQFVLDFTLQGEATPQPSIPTLETIDTTGTTWYSINVDTKVFADLFRIKFTGENLPDWSGVDVIGTDDFADISGISGALNDVLGDHWNVPGTKAKTASSETGYSARDMCNAIAKQFFGSHVAGEIFNNEGTVIETISTGLNNMLQNGHDKNTNGAAFFLKRMLKEASLNETDRERITHWGGHDHMSSVAILNNTTTGARLPFKQGDTIIINISSFTLTAGNPLTGDSETIDKDTNGGTYASGHIKITLVDNDWDQDYSYQGSS